MRHGFLAVIAVFAIPTEGAADDGLNAVATPTEGAAQGVLDAVATALDTTRTTAQVLRAEKKELFCKKGSGKDEDTEVGQNILSKLGGDPNRFNNIVDKANKSGTVSKSVVRDAAISETFGTLSWETSGVYAAALVLLLFLFFCFQIWPCCKFCRCCSKLRHRGSTGTKSVTCVVILLCTILVLAGVCITLYGAHQVNIAKEHASCNMATLADAALSDNTNTPGVISMIDQTTELVTLLTPSSLFVTDIRKFTTSTKQLKESMDDVEKTIKEDTKATFPPGCTHFSEDVEALLAARRVVHETFATEDATLGKHMAKARDAMNDVSKNITKRVDSAITEKKKEEDSFYDYGLYGTLGISIASLLVLICAYAPMFLFFTREVRVVGESVNPYSKSLAHTASFSWCSGCIFGIIILMISGALMLLVAISSGACLAADDLAVSRAKQIFKVTDVLNMTPDDEDFVLQCLLSDSDGQLLNMASWVCDGDNDTEVDDGRRCTAYKELTETITTITAKVDLIKDKSVATVNKNNCATSVTSMSKSTIKTALHALVAHFENSSLYDKIAEWKTLVTKSFLTPANKLKSDTACKNLKPLADDVISNVCYEGVYSAAIFVLGCLMSGVAAAMLGILMFFIWRHAADNRAEWSQLENCDDGQATLRRGHYTFRI